MKGKGEVGVGLAISLRLFKHTNAKIFEVGVAVDVRGFLRVFEAQPKFEVVQLVLKALQLAAERIMVENFKDAHAVKALHLSNLFEGVAVEVFTQLMDVRLELAVELHFDV